MDPSKNSHPFPNIFKECPLQALVGSEKTVHYIHPGVLACSNSPVLQARVHERWMKDEVNKVIDWTDFDEETIQCVLNYLYTGTYHVPRQDAVPEEDQEDEREDEEVVEEFDENVPMVRGNVHNAAFARMYAQRSHRTRDRPASDSRREEAHNERPLERPAALSGRWSQASSYLTPETEEEPVAEPSNERQSISDECLGNIALLHSKVYCFAHQYLFSELEDLAYQHLKQVLRESKEPSDSFFTPLANAIRLVYDSTLSPSKKNPARKLLYRYVAYTYTRKSQHEGVLGPLIAEGGDFAVDLARKLAEKAQAYHPYMEKLESQLEVLKFREMDRTLLGPDPMGLWTTMNPNGR
ncbi:hypothetical protein N7528_004185 [Penicillium herquei]|nr:hypothetical protein N7528_004185 [Penicillium herquei]